MTLGLVILALVWLLALTVLLAGLIRHVATLSLAGSAAPVDGSAGFNFETDGPWVPSALPEKVVDVFRIAKVSTDDLVAVFFSAACKSCLERAEDIARSDIDPERVVFLLAGHHPEGLENLREALEPTRAQLLLDPDAHDVVKSLDINSTPFAFRVLDSEIVAKTYIRGIDDFTRLAADELTNRDQFDARPLERDVATSAVLTQKG